MNIEAYNLDSLRKLVRSLQDENRRLKVLLDKADIAYEPENVFEEKIETAQEYDPDQGERMFMLKEAPKADIFHNAITDGIIGYVRNSVVRKLTVKRVNIQSGLNLNPRKLWSIFLDTGKMGRM